jgi:hypothetical protein
MQLRQPNIVTDRVSVNAPYYRIGMHRADTRRDAPRFRSLDRICIDTDTATVRLVVNRSITLRDARATIAKAIG